MSFLDKCMYGWVAGSLVEEARELDESRQTTSADPFMPWFKQRLNKAQNKPETKPIVEDEIDLIKSMVVKCKHCNIMPTVTFYSFDCTITCPECGQSVGGSIDPLDDKDAWNDLNKTTKRIKNAKKSI